MTLSLSALAFSKHICLLDFWESNSPAHSESHYSYHFLRKILLWYLIILMDLVFERQITNMEGIIENLKGFMDAATKRLKIESEIASRYSVFLEEAKTDIKSANLLSSNESGIKRRKLYFIEQSLEKSCKAVYPLLLKTLKTIELTEIDKIMQNYNPKKLSHHPKELKEEISKNLLFLNEVENNLGTFARTAFENNDVLSLISAYNKLSENTEFFMKNQNKIWVAGPIDLKLFEKFSKTTHGVYLIVFSIWMVLGQYEQEFRYPPKKPIPVDLLDASNGLQKFVENFITYAEQYSILMTNIKF